MFLLKKTVIFILLICWTIHCLENPRPIQLDNVQLFPNSLFSQSYQYLSTPAYEARLNRGGFYCGNSRCSSTVNLS